MAEGQPGGGVGVENGGGEVRQSKIHEKWWCFGVQMFSPALFIHSHKKYIQNKSWDHTTATATRSPLLPSLQLYTVEQKL